MMIKKIAQFRCNILRSERIKMKSLGINFNGSQKNIEWYIKRDIPNLNITWMGGTDESKRRAF